MQPPNVTGSVTHDGVESSSNSLTADQIRDSLGLTTDPASPELPTESTPAEPVTETVTSTPTEPAKPKKKDPQARIDQVVYEREEAKREAAKREADHQREIGSLREEMQRELAELRRMARPEPKTPEPQGDPEPNPEDTATYPDGQFDRKYLKDQARWEARQEFQAQQTAFQQRQQQEQSQRQQVERDQSERGRIQKLSQRMTSAFQTHPDLQAKLEGVSMTRPMWDVVMESEVPDQILAYMADHSEEAERIASLPPLHAFRALSRIEYQLESAAALTGTAPAKPTTSAHPPVSPVGGSHASPKGGPPDPNTCTQEEFDAYWNAEEKTRGGRR